MKNINPLVPTNKFAPLDIRWGDIIMDFKIVHGEYGRYYFLKMLYYYEYLGDGFWYGTYRLEDARLFYLNYLNSGLEPKAYYEKVLGL